MDSYPIKAAEKVFITLFLSKYTKTDGTHLFPLIFCLYHIQTISLLQNLWVHKIGMDIKVLSMSQMVHVTAQLIL